VELRARDDGDTISSVVGGSGVAPIIANYDLNPMHRRKDRINEKMKAL
jgi:hypothetical protein